MMIIVRSIILYFPVFKKGRLGGGKGGSTPSASCAKSKPAIYLIRACSDNLSAWKSYALCS